MRLILLGAPGAGKGTHLLPLKTRCCPFLFLQYIL